MMAGGAKGHAFIGCVLEMLRALFFGSRFL
jgi:hypothetical protein